MENTHHLGANSNTIRIMVGYAWEKEKDNKLKAPRSDSRWKFLKERAQSVSKTIATIAESRPGAQNLDIKISRLRGQHGQLLLPNLIRRIESADILLMDIGSFGDEKSFNSNVLLEVGMALSRGHHERGGLFIFKPANTPIPSDLNGFLFTDYVYANKADPNEIKLVDSHGFHAALRSVTMGLAMERGMIGDALSSTIKDDDEQYDYEKDVGIIDAESVKS